MTITITDSDKLRCVERELRMRKKVYPNFVRRGSMQTQQADYEIAVMDAIRQDYSAKVDPMFGFEERERKNENGPKAGSETTRT